MTQPASAPPATFVIFGALGDLTKRLLVPAIVNLVRDGLLADTTCIIGVSRAEGDDAMLRRSIGEFVESDAAWERVSSSARYLQGDFTAPATFRKLKEMVAGAAVFYLATPPDAFGGIVDLLGEAGLMEESDGFRRIVIEKPFGLDLASARELNARILARVPEPRIYRIDHFLGKETVQNILIARLGNRLFENSWDGKIIDHVQITVAEAVGVGTRGKFYDATGALRDMVPNHLFQLLALIAMEPPESLEPEAVRNAKARLIAEVQPIRPEEAVRGRYEAGSADGNTIKAYRDADAVAADSNTETYAAMKVRIGTPRWSGVPFYLRTGKAMTARDSEIVIQFKQSSTTLFAGTDVGTRAPNRLVLQLQPGEALNLDFIVKQPGPLLNAAGASMTFSYKDRFAIEGRTGYETLLYDVLTGDQTLFQRADQIEGGWRAIEPLIKAWREGEPDTYPAGSAGPASADRLLAADGRTWHGLGSCPDR